MMIWITQSAQSCQRKLRESAAQTRRAEKHSRPMVGGAGKKFCARVSVLDFRTRSGRFCGPGLFMPAPLFTPLLTIVLGVH